MLPAQNALEQSSLAQNAVSRRDAAATTAEPSRARHRERSRDTSRALRARRRARTDRGTDPRLYPRGVHVVLRRSLVDGDRRAWCELIERYAAPIHLQMAGGLRRRGFRASPVEVEDHVQELWLRLLRAGDAYRGVGDRQAWAYIGRCIRHLTIDRLRATTAGCRAAEVDPEWRRRRRLKTPPGSALEALEDGRFGRKPMVALIEHETPESIYLRREALQGFVASCRTELAQTTIGGAPLAVRVRALSLAFVHGATSHEISDALGGRPTPREIDRLAGRLRRRLARRGIDLPRRAGSRTTGACYHRRSAPLGAEATATRAPRSSSGGIRDRRERDCCR